VRVPLEGHAAYRAAQRITPARREEIDALLEELDAEAGAEDPDSLIRLDARVHRFVYHAAGNPYLASSLERYFNLSVRIWYLVLDRLPHLSARVLEHRRMLEAIADGDAELAREIAADHVTTFEQEIRGVL
jgi:DNA-binding GntR family transcriptional regulator